MKIFNLFKASIGKEKEKDLSLMEISNQLNIREADKLSKLFWPSFSVVDGAVFLEWEKISDLDKAYGGGMSRTQLEAFANHVHILDHFKHEANLGDEPWWNSKHPDFKLGCTLAKEIAKMWTSKLYLDFPDEEFLVYYTEEDNPIVRFHKVREGEDPWLDPKQREKEISDEKIIVWNSRKTRHNRVAGAIPDSRPHTTPDSLHSLPSGGTVSGHTGP